MYFSAISPHLLTLSTSRVNGVQKLITIYMNQTMSMTHSYINVTSNVDSMFVQAVNGTSPNSISNAIRKMSSQKK